MGLLVCCVFAYWLMKHAPELVGEAAQAFAAGLRGEESPAMAARRARLQNAGIDPATGGAFRQFTGNAWRDFWLDQDNDRAARRAGKPTGGSTAGGVFSRLRDAFDDVVERRAQAWNRRQSGSPEPDAADFPDQPAPGSGEQPESPAEGPFAFIGEPFMADGTVHPEEPQQDAPPRDPIRVPSTVDQPDTGPATPQPESKEGTVPEDDDTWRMTDSNSERLKHELFGNCSRDPNRCPHCAEAQQRRLRSQAQQQQATTDTLEPIRVASTVEDTSTAPTPVRELEGTPAMTDVAHRGTAVTGVVSGAAEARSIQRHLEAATQAFDAAMSSARSRIHSLGEQTLSVVQMAGKSTVVDATAQAAESIAAAQNGVNTCKAETIPLLGRVAREFDKRNS